MHLDFQTGHGFHLFHEFLDQLTWRGFRVEVCLNPELVLRHRAPGGDSNHRSARQYSRKSFHVFLPVPCEWLFEWGG